MAITGVTDPLNQYATARPNDAGTEFIDLTIKFFRENKPRLTSTDATNVGAEVTNIFNGTHKV